VDEARSRREVCSDRLVMSIREATPTLCPKSYTLTSRELRPIFMDGSSKPFGHRPNVLRGPNWLQNESLALRVGFEPTACRLTGEGCFQHFARRERQRFTRPLQWEQFQGPTGVQNLAFLRRFRGSHCCKGNRINGT
jgi:hypothetical protein